MKNITTLLFPLFLLIQGAIGQHTILWKVTDPATKKTSTIVGTFHQFGNSFVDSIPEIKAGLDASELAIFESIGDIKKTQQTINDRDYTSGIEKAFSNKYYQQLQAIAKDWKVNLTKLKPIELRWKLQQQLIETQCQTVKPWDTWDHFDNYLIHLAQQQNIEVFGLETDEEQLELISQEHEHPDWNNERKNIIKTLQKFSGKKINPNQCAFAQQYQQYDLDYELSKPCPQDVLLQQRNAKWMNILPQLLRSKNCFVAVGLFHLYRECGLLEQLKKEGFVVEAIEIDVVKFKQ